MVEPTGFINVNVSLNEQSQVRTYLDVRYEGPIPEGLMRRLHELIKQAIQQELDRLGSSIQCLGVRFGYDLSEASELQVDTEGQSSRRSSEQYYVECFGCYTQHQALLEHASIASITELSSDESNNTVDTDNLDNFLSRDFLDSLLSRAQEEVNSHISPSELGTKSLQPWLFGYAKSNGAFRTEQTIAFASSDSACCTTGKPRQRKPATALCDGKRCSVIIENQKPL